ncbi:hypothetical protein TNCV_1012921 [Trichonephila clavipes]|uniref:Uncharacterized protein n=1 Tax=Trichonephila clavipes TaxID=2585209 RepID=A0A8X7B9S7_TRICX|nr:hypothetical protein TNCV_1012921 [Trichonephila clavipes]
MDPQLRTFERCPLHPRATFVRRPYLQVGSPYLTSNPNGKDCSLIFSKHDQWVEKQGPLLGNLKNGKAKHSTEQHIYKKKKLIQNILAACKNVMKRLDDKRSKTSVTAGSDVVQSGRPIFDDFFQHLWPYIGNNTANVVFQMVKRLWLIRIDQ